MRYRGAAVCTLLVVVVLGLGAIGYVGFFFYHNFTSKKYPLLAAPLFVDQKRPSVIDIRGVKRHARNDVMVSVERQVRIRKYVIERGQRTKVEWEDGMIAGLTVSILDGNGSRHVMQSYGDSGFSMWFWLPVRNLPARTPLTGLEIETTSSMNIRQITWCDGTLH